MNSWLNYHHLYYFRTIANEGSIARAAEKLRLGQPTLSAQLKQLEDSLGTSLFERRHKKLVLTEQGRKALEYANEIFRLGSEMLEVLQDKPASARVHLAVGALDSVPKNVILALTKAAYKMGNCVVSVLEGKGDDLIHELALHRIDLMIANYIPSIQEMEKIRSRRLAQVPVLVCGAPPFKGLRKNFPKSLHHAPFILPTRHSKLRHDLDHYFRTQSISVDPVAESQDTSFQKVLGVAGIGLIPAPLFAVDELLRDKSLVEIGRLPGLSEEIYLLSASRRIENPVAHRLFEKFELNF